MRHTIYSRKLRKAVTFSRPGQEYLFVDLNGQPGTLGFQMCEGGGLRGTTLMYSGENAAAFERVCRRWWKQYLHDLRRIGA